ncbi:protein TolR [bacterium]|nr:protein TolR [bacterium]
MPLMLKRGPGRRRANPLSAEINVTPFVDVMLVLLVIFMITAPMLATGVPVDLPKTRADPLPSGDDQPLVVTVDREGQIFVGTQDQSVTPDQLAPMLASIARDDLTKRVYVRGDTAVAYGKVVGVLALLQGAGFRNAGMVVDPDTAARALEGG